MARGRPRLDERRLRVDLRLSSATLERLGRALELSEHSTRTAVIEEAVERYVAELERAPIDAAVVRALALPQHDVDYIPEHLREADLDAGAFKAWLTEYSPKPDATWTKKQLKNRREVNPEADFSDRFVADKGLPAIATKREYLVLLVHYGYDSDERYWFVGLWREFLKSGKAFVYTQ